MLNAYVSMCDIDVDHWRNLQSLLLESAKARPRIILIHENGELLKFVHSQRSDIVRSVDRVDDPHAVAEKVFRDNPGKADFVAVFERRAFDRYFGQVQDTWKPDEDLDEYVHRTYEMMDEWPDAIVTYPGPARSQLGLQWRVGASYEDIKAAVRQFVPANSTVLFGIFEGDSLWAALVLGFDENLSVKTLTTGDPRDKPAGGNWHRQAQWLVDWANRVHQPVSVGMFTDLAGARALAAAHDKLATLRDLAAQGRLLADPLPEPLKKLMARA